MKTQLKVGFIGAGQFARAHMASVTSQADAQIVGLWDYTEPLAQEAAAKFGGTVYPSIAELLDRAHPDAVYIVTMPAGHGQPERLCLERNIPMFVEKPVALQMSAALDILKQIQAKKLITAVGYQWRYLDLVNQIKTQLPDAGPVMAQGFWLSRLPGAAWWRQKKFSGGQLIEQATHMFDLARYLFGEVAEVQAVAHTVAPTPERDIEKASSVNLRFANGMPVNISATCALPIRYRGGFTVLAEKAVYELISTASGTENTILNIIDKEGTRQIRAGNHPMQIGDRTFLDAVRTGNPDAIRSDYENAVRSLRLSLAAYESIETHQVVRL